MARKSLTSEEASLLCIIAQGRHLMDNDRCRDTLLGVLQSSTILVQRVGGLILGVEQKRHLTGRDRRLATAFISWADSLGDEIEQRAEVVERQATKDPAQTKRRSPAKLKLEQTVWGRALTDEL